MNSNLKIHCLKDLKEISNFVFEIFSDVHYATNNRFYVIPGGSTPKVFLNLLSKKIIDWSNTRFILSDERLINDKQISKFKDLSEIEIGINHKEYSHTTKLHKNTINSLSADFS